MEAWKDHLWKGVLAAPEPSWNPSESLLLFQLEAWEAPLESSWRCGRAKPSTGEPLSQSRLGGLWRVLGASWALWGLSGRRLGDVWPK